MHFRIRINVFIVLESIFICIVEYFYHRRTWQTKLFRLKKYWKNKNMRTLFHISILYFSNAIATNQIASVKKRLKNKKKKKRIWERFRCDMNRWVYSMQRIRIRWDEELRWLVDWIFASSFLFTFFALLFFCFVFFFFFLFTVCTSIIFFFRIVRIYVLSLLFLVYIVHINHFFSSIL